MRLASVATAPESPRNRAPMGAAMPKTAIIDNEFAKPDKRRISTPLVSKKREKTAKNAPVNPHFPPQIPTQNAPQTVSVSLFSNQSIRDFKAKFEAL